MTSETIRNKNGDFNDIKCAFQIYNQLKTLGIGKANFKVPFRKSGYSCYISFEGNAPYSVHIASPMCDGEYPLYDGTYVKV